MENELDEMVQLKLNTQKLNEKILNSFALNQDLQLGLFEKVEQRNGIIWAVQYSSFFEAFKNGLLSCQVNKSCADLLLQINKYTGEVARNNGFLTVTSEMTQFDYFAFCAIDEEESNVDKMKSRVMRFYGDLVKLFRETGRKLGRINQSKPCILAYAEYGPVTCWNAGSSTFPRLALFGSSHDEATKKLLDERVQLKNPYGLILGMNLKKINELIPKETMNHFGVNDIFWEH
ncbi:hypothetical protein Ciccas_001953 [Cichlidogyrus casuarinus]|uniref:Uncharacterized protein n=1 Tax=Cichlidogyrus casuarinus TaxID=1844966 RepID=A0ABD2QIX6_9PLAT